MAVRVRRWRWSRRRVAFFAIVLAAALVVTHYLQPAQLTALILARASGSLHLDLRTSGPGSYALRPEPRLVLPGFTATIPGNATPFFRSGQVELALPWNTLRGKGSDISSVVLKSPDIDVQGLRNWLAAQPPSTRPFKLPTLTRGLSVSDGSLHGANWKIEHLDFATPTLADGKAATLDVSGDFTRASTSSHFAAHATATAAGAGQGLRVDDLDLSLKADGELPSLVVAGHALASDTLDLDLRGSLQRVPASWSSLSDSAFAQPGDTPFAIAIAHKPATTVAGIPVADPQSGWRLRLSLGDAKRQPTLSLQAQENGEAFIDASLTAQLSRWPDAWPGLPATFASTAVPLVFAADYHGPLFPPGPLAFSLKRGDTALQGNASIADLRTWARGGFASVLPPVQATLDAPALDVGGVQLRGVHAEVRDDDAPTQPESAPASTGAPRS
ncbi:MAG TPA: hypothetical protein VGH80_08635 [Xanthomonadaceae bacterium]|jgi:hypothetical protein